MHAFSGEGTASSGGSVCVLAANGGTNGVTGRLCLVQALQELEIVDQYTLVLAIPQPRVADPSFLLLDVVQYQGGVVR